ETISSSPSWATVMSRGMRSWSSPLGPLTVTRLSSIAIDTPDGTGIGLRPMRLIASSPDLRHDLAADALLARVVTGHDAVRRRDDRRAHAALDLGQVRVVGVAALAGARHAAQAVDRALALLGVLERDADDLAGVVGVRRLDVVGLDVALLAQNPRELLLEL